MFHNAVRLVRLSPRIAATLISVYFSCILLSRLCGAYRYRSSLPVGSLYGSLLGVAANIWVLRCCSTASRIVMGFPMRVCGCFGARAVRWFCLVSLLACRGLGEISSMSACSSSSSSIGKAAFSSSVLYNISCCATFSSSSFSSSAGSIGSITGSSE